MISLISSSRCIGCGTCAQVCPTNVFDFEQGGLPVIARQSDCQTCFICEAYCPADALFVAAEAHRQAEFNEQTLVTQGLLGAYRRQLGWAKGYTTKDRINRLRELRDDIEANPYPETASAPASH